MTERGSAAGRQRMYSEVLGLELRVSERGFHFHDPVAGKDLLSLTERGEALERAEQARAQERQARERAERRWQRAERERQEAEARIAALEAKLRDRRTAEQ